MTVEILDPTLRDMTYIGANLRDEDRRETLCQLPAGMMGSSALAGIYNTLTPGWDWIAYLNGQPAAAFGFQPMTTPVWQAWALGTRAMTRVIPAITRWCWSQEQRLIDAGVRRVEARSIEGHDQAHRWLERLGCSRVCALPDHGRDGELFYLYAWHLGAGRPTHNTRYRMRRNVFQNPQASEGAEPATAADAPVEAGG